MGVRRLHACMRYHVPNGSFVVNIKEEIRKYYSSSDALNRPPPVIVVDLVFFLGPFIGCDIPGVICGGRSNEMEHRMDTFFSELVDLGVELHFFCDGPVTIKSGDARYDQTDYHYQNVIKMMDAVDNGENFSTLVHYQSSLSWYISILRKSAMRHGRYHWATARESDQQMAAFANQSGALAIMTNDSDMLIYKGSFRIWYLKTLNITKFTLTEYDRTALREYLGLNPAQMPLLATLAGNDLVDPKALEKFNRVNGRREYVSNVANFIRLHRNDSEERILIKALEFCSNRRTLMECFRESLSCYSLHYQPFNHRYINDPMEALLLSRKISLFYLMWHSYTITFPSHAIDLREVQLGQEVLRLTLSMLLRMGGIILRQRQTQRRMVDYSKCHLMIQQQHDTSAAIQHFNVEFPNHMQSPPLEELFSKDPVTMHELLDVKHELLSWIVSKSLNHSRIRAIPQQLQITVLTLYALVESRILELPEADLLLQIAYDVAFNRYDPAEIAYPRTLASRPFRVAFVFLNVHEMLAKAYVLVGLTESPVEDPPLFDGVLFHNRYTDWKNGHSVDTADEIMEWRIYTSVVD